jgi:hypothetical protein
MKIGSELATVEASLPRSSIHFDEPARSVIRECLSAHLSKSLNDELVASVPLPRICGGGT